MFVVRQNFMEVIKKAMQNGTLIIDYMGGASNLPYKLTYYQNIQCKYHVLLDNDEAGRNAGQIAENQGLLTTRTMTYTMCNGSPNAELEDCYAKDAYANAIYVEYGVDLNVKEFRGNKKWSDRMGDCFKSQGKQWTEAMKKKVKLTVASEITANSEEMLDSHKRSSIDALVGAINSMLA